MLRLPSFRATLCAASALTLALVANTQAGAATPDEGIAGIESKIRHLQAQLDAVRSWLA